MASETGVLETAPSEIVSRDGSSPASFSRRHTRKYRAGAGNLRRASTTETYAELARAAPSEAERRGRDRCRDRPRSAKRSRQSRNCRRTVQMPALPSLQRAFGYTLELLRLLVQPMVEDRQGSGRLDGRRHAAGRALRATQTALPVFPPALRAGLESATRLRAGRPRHLAAKPRSGASTICSPKQRNIAGSSFFESPILTDRRSKQSAGSRNGIRSCLRRHRPIAKGRPLRGDRRNACGRRSPASRKAAKSWSLTDREIGPERVAIPSLLAIGAVHHHLIRKGCAPARGW